MEPAGLLMFSQVLAINSNPEADKSTLYHPTLLHFNISLSMPRSSKWLLCFTFSNYVNISMTFFSGYDTQFSDTQY
jgi:hypothetical protein